MPHNFGYPPHFSFFLSFLGHSFQSVSLAMKKKTIIFQLQKSTVFDYRKNTKPTILNLNQGTPVPHSLYPFKVLW